MIYFALFIEQYSQSIIRIRKNTCSIQQMNANNDDGKAVDRKLNGNDSQEYCASMKCTKKQNKKNLFLLISITEHETVVSFSFSKLVSNIYMM